MALLYKALSWFVIALTAKVCWLKRIYQSSVQETTSSSIFGRKDLIHGMIVCIIFEGLEEPVVRNHPERYQFQSYTTLTAGGEPESSVPTMTADTNHVDLPLLLTTTCSHFYPAFLAGSQVIRCLYSKSPKYIILTEPNLHPRSSEQCKLWFSTFSK